jgi:CheY-like chemotaxis protein
MRFENQALADMLNAEKLKAEELNQTLEAEVEARKKVRKELEIHQSDLESQVFGGSAELRQAKEAGEAVKNNVCDLILMDFHLPELDGFQSATTIRQTENLQGVRHVPIIALTADVKKGTDEQCVAAGMNDFMSKPFNQDQLAAMIGDW